MRCRGKLFDRSSFLNVMNAMQYDGSLLLVALLAGFVAQWFFSIIH